jgi:hypothetical protein
MNEKSQILIYMLIAVFVIMVKTLLSAKRDPIPYILLFYFFFGFGPVINYMYGVNIYFGTVEANILDASLIMLLGIVSFAIPHIFIRSEKLSLNKSTIKHQWGSLYSIYTVSLVYGVFRVLLMLPYRIGGASKIELINIALPSLHYIYLIVQLYLCAFYINIKDDIKLKRIFFLNLAIYIIYCLIIGERDFIFTLFSFFIIKMILGNKKEFILYVLSSVVLILFATAIFFLRDSTQERASAISGVLNQGSILFINTYVLKIIENGHEYFNGWTYLNSIMNLLPSWIYKSDFNLQQWFHNIYAKNSTSGYGFALDAEAYLNYGYVGVVMFFTSFSLYWKLLIIKFNSSEFFRYLLFFSIGFTMYSLRNDSLSLFKGTLYAMLCYAFVNTSSYLMTIWRNK